MGNCCERCFGKFDKRRYLRTRYNVERDISIEFENLMDEESQDNDLTRANVPLLTDSEKAWLQSCRYDILVEEQKFVDDKLKKELVQQEDELRREEEAYCHAKGQGFQAVRSLLKKDGGFQRLSPSPNLQHKSQATWLEENDGNWDVAVDEEDDDDFESFLECVKARSAAARNHVNNLLVVPDMVSDDDRSKTEASSIDLEWEHEAGMQPIQASGKKTLYSTSIEDDTKPSLRTEKLSSDFEWDNDFVGGPSQLCSKIDTINNNVSGNLNCLHNHSLAAASSAENIPPR